VLLRLEDVVPPAGQDVADLVELSRSYRIAFERMGTQLSSEPKKRELQMSGLSSGNLKEEKVVTTSITCYHVSVPQLRSVLSAELAFVLQSRHDC